MYPLIEVTDRDGWFKAFQPSKTLLWLGGADQNDIALPSTRGQGVEPRHVQLLFNQEQGMYTVLNMSNNALPALWQGRSQTIPPRNPTVLPPESTLQIGDYRVALRLATADYGNDNAAMRGAATTYPPAPAALPDSNGGQPALPRPPVGTYDNPPAAPSLAPWMNPDALPRPAQPAADKPPALPRPTFPAAPAAPERGTPRPPTAAVPATTRAPIGLTVRWVSATLDESTPAEALIMISNRGPRGAVQFNLTIQGIPTESYEIPPLPILFPNAEAQVRVTFTYPSGTVLKAGTHAITFIASAPDSYPNEQAAMQLALMVPTVYRHTLSVKPLS